MALDDLGLQCALQKLRMVLRSVPNTIRVRNMGLFSFDTVIVLDKAKYNKSSNIFTIYGHVTSLMTPRSAILSSLDKFSRSVQRRVEKAGLN